MKFHDNELYEYIDNYEKKNLRNNAIITYDDLKNIIIYGPSGVGKYSSVLYYLSKFSQSKLKYDKKIAINITKDNIYYIRISDIHYEIDIEQLGCNAKQLWHEIYIHIIYMVQQSNNTRVIVCKNFHKINNDLLKVFYSYIQDSRQYQIKIIIITDHLSFIPNNIYKSFNIIMCPIFNKTKCIKTLGKVSSKNKLDNLKSYSIGFPLSTYSNKKSYELYTYLLEYPNINYKTVRDYLYDILIYDIDISMVLWDLIQLHNKITNSIDTAFIVYLNNFLQMYNNNYRPIYHLEKIIYYILNRIHESK